MKKKKPKKPKVEDLSFRVFDRTKIEEENKKFKIRILVEKDNDYLEFKLTTKQICALFDFQYMIDRSCIDNLKLNNILKEIQDFFKIIEAMEDAIHGGDTYQFKGKKLVKTKHKFYLRKKPPAWKKKDAS